jgi:hypothetical protein
MLAEMSRAQSVLKLCYVEVKKRAERPSKQTVLFFGSFVFVVPQT